MGENPSDYLKQVWDLDDPDRVSAIDELSLWSAPFGLALLDTVAYRPNLKVLDIGSGLGFPALELAQRLGPGSQVYALDPWEAASRRLTFKFRQMGLTNVTIVQDMAEAMPFADTSFDLITSNNALNNVQDIETAWQQCYRVARPDAQMVVTENLPESMRDFYDCLRQVCLDLSLDAAVSRIAEQIRSKRKPLDWTLALIRRTGFEVVECRQQEFSLRFTSGTAMLNHSLIRIGFLNGWKTIVPEPDQGRVFAQVEDRLNKLAERQGQLRLTIPFVCIDCHKPL
jgi:ubiquinone/menaquinone biosynthesis C-methylase UbiE